VLARDKALSKKILSYHRIRVPQFAVFPYAQKIRKSTVDKLRYPMIVKSLTEEGSIGIAQASFVNTPDELVARVEHMHQLTRGDVIAEQYIDGRELYVTVIGNQRLDVLPVRELVFGKVDADLPHMATYKVKWDDDYRERWGIDYIYARNMPHGVPDAIKRLCKRVYKILDQYGYARMDLRLSPDANIYVLEANPNPGISSIDDVALSAERAGMKYPQLIQKLLNLGLRARQ
jgi:D-alanine-D-alanine ligase